MQPFSFEIKDEETRPYYVQSFKQGASHFAAVYIRSNNCLIIYHSFAHILQEKETARFMIEFADEYTRFTSSIVFSKLKPYVIFPNVSTPCSMYLRRAISTNGPDDIPYVGINNMGMTCYIASVLQLFSTISPFITLMFSEDTQDGTVSKEFQKLLLDYLTATNSLSIKDFVSSFGGNSFEMAIHENDAHEFLLILFDKLDKDLGKDFEARRNEIFGVYASRVIDCPLAKIKNETQEISSDIQLPILGYSNLYDSLHYLTESEKLEGENKWDTGTDMGKQVAYRYLKYKKLPPVLLFQLLRYQYNPSSETCEEIRTAFDCPNDIDLTDFCVEDNKDCKKYKMFAVVSHRGNLQTGHYVTYAQPKFDDNWFLFDDSRVSRASIKDVRSTFHNHCSVIKRMLSVVTGGHFLAYVVGYARVDMIEQFRKVPFIPASIAPHLSTAFIARVVDTESINDKDIYSTAVSIDWIEEEKTVSDIVSKEGVVFAQLPSNKEFFGPINKKDAASRYCVHGHQTTFFVVPSSEAEDPVFFYIGSEFKGVYSKKRLLKEFSGVYVFVVDGRVVDDFPTGSLVFGITNKKFVLKINKKEYEVPINASYEDLQLLYVGKEISKAPSILFYNQNTALRPTVYRTALRLRIISDDLEARVLEKPATAMSLDLFLPLNIDFYDLGHTKRTKSGLWFKRGQCVGDLINYLPSWFDFKKDPNYVYIVAANAEHYIPSILKETDPVTYTNLRVQELKCQIPESAQEFTEMVEEIGFSALEIKTLTNEEGLPHYRTLGFYMITKSHTANSLSKTILKNPPYRFSIHSNTSFYNYYSIEGRDVLVGLIAQIAEKREWKGHRPYLLFQLNEPPKTPYNPYA